MAGFDGSWDTVVKTPLGDQQAVFAFTVDGLALTGFASGAMGSTEISDGQVLGDGATWKMQVSTPFPMTLEADVMLEGDAFTGSVTAGAFGAFPIKGVRKA